MDPDRGPRSSVAAPARPGDALAPPWHERVPSLYLVAAAVVIGDGAGTHLSLWIPAAAGITAGALFIASWRGAGLAVALLAIALAAGSASARIYDPPRDPLSIRNWPENRNLYLWGSIERQPESTLDGSRFDLRLTQAGGTAQSSRPAAGTVRVTVLAPDRYRLGERLQVMTRVRLPRNYGDPGEFDYAAYMARERVDATAVVRTTKAIVRIGYTPRFPWSAIERVRGRIGGLIDSSLDEPQRAEMRALIIGDRGALNPDVRQTFALSGMAHLLVISGLHLGFVAGAAFGLMRLCCWLFPYLLIRGYANKLAAAASGLAVLGYAAIAGGHFSTLRALIMVLCYVVAVVADRGREVIASLALAGLLICLWFPGSSADLGFQLSFAAVAGVVLGMRRFSAWWSALETRAGLEFRGRAAHGLARVMESAAGYVAVSFFALLGTAPLTARYFNQFSVVGLIANAVVVPIMALGGVVLGLLAALAGILSTGVALYLMSIAGLAVTLSNYLARAFVAWPDAWVRTFTPTGAEIALYYVLIGLWLLAPLAPRDELDALTSGDARGRWRRRALPVAAIVALAIAADAGWWTRERYFDSRLRVTFLSVGQGEAAVVQFPGARVMLIDGGGRYRESDFGERVVAPFLWSRKIMHVDRLALSHPELDHFAGFQFIARNFHPDEFWTTGAASPDTSYRALLDTLRSAGTRVVLVDDRAPAEVIGGVTIHCLGPDSAFTGSRNNRSMVLELEKGRRNFLFTGDVEARGERQLVQRNPRLPVTVLKVPHHGSATSSTAALIKATAPNFAVISAGYYNRYHFPADAVVARYRLARARVLVTSQAGAIGFVTDGQELDAWTGADERPLPIGPLR